MTEVNNNTQSKLTNTEQLIMAEKIAREQHAGQKDKGGNDYINHPATVVSYVKTDTEKTVAWLHDVLEDTDYTENQLKDDGFNDDIINAVILLTHEKNQPYAEYIQKLSENEIARHVKIADIISNLDLSRLSDDEKTSENELRRINKYMKALDTLTKKELIEHHAVIDTTDDSKNDTTALQLAGFNDDVINVFKTELNEIRRILNMMVKKNKKNNVNKDDGNKNKLSKLFNNWNFRLIGVIIFLVIIILSGLFWAPKGPSEIPSNEGFALLKNDKAVEEVTVQDYAQNIVVKLKDNYTRKTDNKNVGKEVQFGWSLGQRENLGKILDKSDYEKGYTVIGSKSNFWGNFIASLVPTLLIAGLIIWMLKSSEGIGGISGLNGSKDVDAIEDKPNVTFKDVAGEDTALVELKEIKDMLANPDKYIKIGAKLPKGVLLYGPPGTGKTLLAKALAGEVGVPFFYTSGASFVNVFAGMGSRNVRNLFDKARKAGKCLIFIDEIDALNKRGSGSSGNSENDQTLNQLLTCMDGFESDGNIIVIAATNRPDMLDKALLRPGRFDRQIGVDLPDLKGREDILKVHARGKTFENGDEHLHWVAQNTSGFSGAQLANVINEAALMAVRENRDAINLDDLSEAIDRTLMGPKKTTREDYKKTLKLTAYHEAGHALAAMATPGSDPVNKITILPRSNALGYTAINSDDDKTNYTKSQLFGQLNYMLGGWAAEELVFNDVSTGPSNDIEKATGLARNMITKYGFSSKLGIGVWAYDRSDPDEMPVSDATLHETDVEVRDMIKKAHDNAVEALTINRSVLDELANALLDKETLTPDDLKPITAKVVKI